MRCIRRGFCTVPVYRHCLLTNSKSRSSLQSRVELDCCPLCITGTSALSHKAASRSLLTLTLFSTCSDLIKWGTSVSSDELSLPSNEFSVSYKELRVLQATSQRSAQQSSLWKSVSDNDSLFCRSIACVQALCTMHSLYLTLRCPLSDIAHCHCLEHPKHPLKHAKHRKSNRKYAVDTAWAGQEDEHGSCDANCYRSQRDLVTVRVSPSMAWSSGLLLTRWKG